MRPKNWKNPYKNKEHCWERLCFERGADAMLEGLREGAFWVITDSQKVEIDGLRCFTNGRLVFIPDEEIG